MKFYKILKILPLCFTQHYHNIYLNHPNLQTLSYEEQLSFLETQGFVYLNGFSSAMKKVGVDAKEVIYDAEILQKTWARESNVFFEDNYWSWQILLQQIIQFKPDILFFQNSGSLPFIIRQWLKKDFPFIKHIIMYIGSTVDTKTLKELTDIDLLFTCNKFCLNFYREHGIRSELVYHGFDSRIFKWASSELNNESVKYQLTFVGSSGYGFHDLHAHRFSLLKKLHENTPIFSWLTEGSNDRIHSRKLSDMFSTKCFPAVYGITMYNILKNSYLTVNTHSPQCGLYGNIRTFEATGMGTCLITDFDQNITDIFEPDKEIITYQSIDECLEKIIYLLDHNDIAVQIAKAGQLRTIKDHTIEQRCQQIDNAIQKIL